MRHFGEHFERVDRVERISEQVNKKDIQISEESMKRFDDLMGDDDLPEVISYYA